MLEVRQRILDLINHSESRRGLKYVVVGIISVAINYILFLLCLQFGTSNFVAAVVGYVAGLLNSFVMGYFIVFKRRQDAPPRSVLEKLITFLLVYFAGGLMMGFGVEFGVKSMHLPPSGAWLIVAAFVVVWNYLGSKFIVFRGDH